MAEFKFPDRSEVQAMLDEAEAAEGLSAWEEEFLTNIREKFDGDPWWEPSERQEEVLRRIAVRGGRFP